MFPIISLKMRSSPFVLWFSSPIIKTFHAQKTAGTITGPLVFSSSSHRVAFLSEVVAIVF
jgi:hypothetical protein